MEHCYPELVPGHPTELPAIWRHLPALALPDGSHNYLSDTIFFNLPALSEPAHTVYGVSCFRQIPVEVGDGFCLYYVVLFVILLL